MLKRGSRISRATLHYTSIRRSAAFALLVGAFLITAPITSRAQVGPGEDRLAAVRDLTNSSELFLLFSEEIATNTSGAKQLIYDLDLSQSDVADRLVGSPVQSGSEVAGRRRLDVTAGNFLGMETELVVAAWTGIDDSVTVAIPDIDSGTLSWTDAEEITIDSLLDDSGELHVASGNLTGSGHRDEAVVGFIRDDGALDIRVLAFEGASLQPVQIALVDDESTSTGHRSWELVTGDFDGDNMEEFAVLFIRPGAGSDWNAVAKIYEFDDEGMLQSGPEINVFQRPSVDYTSVLVAAGSGNLDSDPADEIVTAITFAQQEGGPDTYMYLLDVDPETGELETGAEMSESLDMHNESEIDQVDVGVGNLDGEGTGEVVLSDGDGYRVFQVDEFLDPTSWRTGGATGPEESRFAQSFIAIDDMDADGTDELVFVGANNATSVGEEQEFTFRVLGMIGDEPLQIIATRTGVMPIESDLDRHYAFALGDFDGDRRWLGEPTRYTSPRVLQPSVVLNTPPVHYDVLDGTAYDLSGCYPGQGCGFSATYTQTSSNEMTVDVEVHDDWGASVAATVDLEALKTTVTATYGEKFNKSFSSGESITVSTGRVAEGDDWIYANTMDLDFFEYPVFEGSDPDPIGHFVVAVPKNVRPLWIEAKNDVFLGNQFRPDHEVGNLLSYRAVDSGDADSTIVEFDEQTIGSTGSSSATVELATFSDNGVTQSWEAGLEVSATVGFTADIYGINIGSEVEVSGNYAYSEITTQTVSVRESLEMRADLGRLDTPFGTSGTYQVQPYAYWTAYGALAIDYRVSFPTDVGSFWQTHYGNRTDAGFAMPWRYDEQKGLPLPGGDVTYATRTRDIIVSNPDPQGGETVDLGARVRNMALAPIQQPITVEFWLDDPANGGTLITSTETTGEIDSQSSQNVFVEWAIPESVLPRNHRLYVVLDQEGVLTSDVHTNNDVGWAPLSAVGEPTDREKQQVVPSASVTLSPAYPNPVRGAARIGLDLQRPADIRIAVYDVLGREVALLADERLGSGRHDFRLEADGLVPGVYFYRMRASGMSGGAPLITDTRSVVVTR